MNKTKVQDGRLSLGEKLSYSMGEVATCAMFALFTTPVSYTHLEVKAAAERILGITGGKNATGFILGPGCALGGDTPKENIHAMLNSVK